MASFSGLHLHQLQERKVSTGVACSGRAVWREAATDSKAGSETWVSGIPVVGDSGEVDWGTGAFVLSFVLVVNWTLLQGGKAFIPPFHTCRLSPSSYRHLLQRQRIPCFRGRRAACARCVCVPVACSLAAG